MSRRPVFRLEKALVDGVRGKPTRPEVLRGTPSLPPSAWMPVYLDGRRVARVAEHRGGADFVPVVAAMELDLNFDDGTRRTLRLASAGPHLSSLRWDDGEIVPAAIRVALAEDVEGVTLIMAARWRVPNFHEIHLEAHLNRP